MRYVRARIAEDEERFAYRVYTTDALKAALENTARAVREGMHIEQRWVDIIDPRPADNRTGAEIAADVIKGAGLIFEDGE